MNRSACAGKKFKNLSPNFFICLFFYVSRVTNLTTPRSAPVYDRARETPEYADCDKHAKTSMYDQRAHEI